MLMVMGLPRSGTTWLGKIFDSHPETFYSHEPDTRRFRDVPLLISPEWAVSSRQSLVSEVEELRKLHSLRVVGKLPLFPKRYGAKLSVRARTFAVLALKSASQLTGNSNVPRILSSSPDEASLWVWKSMSPQVVLALARAFPQAKTVFIIRHPCGVAASMLLRGEGAKFSAGSASDDYGFFEMLAETEPASQRKLTLEAFRKMSAARVAWRWALLQRESAERHCGIESLPYRTLRRPLRGSHCGCEVSLPVRWALLGQSNRAIHQGEYRSRAVGLLQRFQEPDGLRLPLEARFARRSRSHGYGYGKRPAPGRLYADTQD